MVKHTTAASTGEGGSPRSGRKHNRGGGPPAGATVSDVRLIKDIKETTTQPANPNPFSKPIVGDVFGTQSDTLLGMLYRSRVQEELHQGPGVRSSSLDAEEKGKKEQDKGADALASSIGSFDMFERDSDSEGEQMETMNPRQQLATTIRNWSTQAENDHYIIHEGAVHALIALAATDDSHIKKCCSAALCNLASREENWEKLLALGAPGGVIAISMQVRSWKIAKTCAQTLAYLSMYEGGESTMAKDGAILALVILLGLKGNRLLPIGAQTLYNLTCTKEHYKGIERIVKAFLSLPTVPAGTAALNPAFDTTLLFLKSVRNSARFSWIRARLIEDGVVVAMNTVAAGLISSTWPFNTTSEAVSLMTENVRLLSESSGVRVDLVLKGGLDILLQCLPRCHTAQQYQNVVKAVHNLASVPGSPALSSRRAFEQAVVVIVTAASESRDTVVLEYVSACLAAFAVEGMRGIPQLVSSVIDVLPGLLEVRVPPTQGFVISACSHLLFPDASLEVDRGKLEVLMVTFVRAGSFFTGEDTSTALAVSLARLSQDDRGVAVLVKHKLLDTVLDLLLEIVSANSSAGQEGSEVVLEVGSVALCRIALLLVDDASVLTPARCDKMAETLHSMLESSDTNILSNAMSSIRALGGCNICVKELLARPTLARIALIMAKYGEDDVALGSLSAAVLASFSYEPEARASLVEGAVLDVLWSSSTKTEDPVTREMVATTICNVSVDIAACRQMVSRGVVEVLATLSGATSEIIQELCAKCFCNLTCATDMHADMIGNKVLQTILMIALVRSVAPRTKHLCARALLNLITEQNVPALKEAGASRIFASISSSPSTTIQFVCAQGFLLMSTSEARRDDLVTRRPVLQALFNMVRCTSARSRVLVGMAICNLLSCPQSQRAAIYGGALPVFKLVAAQEFEELREAAARTIVTLGKCPGLTQQLLSCPVVQILVLLLQTGNEHTFECAVNALSCLSQTAALHIFMIDDGAVVGLVEAILSGRVTTIECATEALRCLCLLSYAKDRVEYMVINCHILLALHVLFRSSLITAESASMVALIIRNASDCKGAVKHVVSEGALLLLRAMLFALPGRSVAVARSVVISLLNISRQAVLHEPLVEQGAVEMLKCVCLGDIDPVPPALVNSELVEECQALPFENMAFTFLDSLRISSTLRHISVTPACREALAFGDVVGIFKRLLDLDRLDEDSRSEVAHCLQNVASSKACVDVVVGQGTAELLLSISRATSSMDTQTACQVSLGQMSEQTKVSHGTVASLLQLTLEKEMDANSDGDGVVSALRLGIRSFDEDKTEVPAPAAARPQSKGSMLGGGGAGGEGAGSRPESRERRTLRTIIKENLASGRLAEVVNTYSPPPDAATSSSAPTSAPDAAEPLPTAKTSPRMLSSSSKSHSRRFSSASLSNFSNKMKSVVAQLTAFEMTSPDAIAREAEVFRQEYERFRFTTFDFSVSVEPGGVVSRRTPSSQAGAGNNASGAAGAGAAGGGGVEAEMSLLPRLDPSDGRIMKARDRGSELSKLTPTMLPLPKDLRRIQDFPPLVDGKEGRERGRGVQQGQGQGQGGEDGYVFGDESAGDGMGQGGGLRTNNKPFGPNDGLSRKTSRQNSQTSFFARRKESLMQQKQLMDALGLLARGGSDKDVKAAAAAAAANPAEESKDATAPSSSLAPPKQSLHSPAGPPAGAAWQGMKLPKDRVTGSVKSRSSSPLPATGSPRVGHSTKATR